MPQPNDKSSRRRQRTVPPTTAADEAPLLVDPRWLLRTIGIVCAIALVLAYLAICGLFLQGQWQLVLHPARTETHRPIDFGLTAQDVGVGPQNEVRAWWIPGATADAAAVLMLPSGDGEASALLGRAHTLHEAGLAVLLVQYRGFGKSAGQHPTEQTMEQDSEWALAELTSRHAPKTVLAYGAGVSASIAVRICAEHHELSGVVLEAPTGDLARQAEADSRSRLVPFRLLFREDFPLADPLRHLATPKLVVSYGATAATAAQAAADPKMLVQLPATTDESAWSESLRRFLDTYVPQAVSGR